jgi:hypothetical protein
MHGVYQIQTPHPDEERVGWYKIRLEVDNINERNKKKMGAFTVLLPLPRQRYEVAHRACIEQGWRCHFRPVRLEDVL